MMSIRTTKFFSTIISFFLVVACKSNYDPITYEKLQYIDNLMQTVPDVAYDNLMQIDPVALDKHNMVYYNLLNIIASHKLYQTFTSDSIIFDVVNFYGNQPMSDNYLKALLYQGIVRLEMGMPDTLIYVPLKKAEEIMLVRPEPIAPSIASRIYFFLGLINEENDNITQATSYYKKAQKYEWLTTNIDGWVGTSLVLFWIYNLNNDEKAAFDILTSIDTIKGISPEQRFGIINAWGSFNYSRKRYRDALANYQELEQMVTRTKGKVWLSAIYDSVSDIYRVIGKPDSALFYKQKAVESISDTSYHRKNHVLYGEFANLASQQGNYELSSSAYKKAFKLLSETVKHETDKRILELEKQYDLSRTEVKAEQYKRRYQFVFFVGVIFLIIIGFGTISYVIHLKRHEVKLENEKLRVQATENEAQQEKSLRQVAENEARHQETLKQQKERLLLLYKVISKNFDIVRTLVEQLSQQYINKKPEKHEMIKSLLIEYKRELMSTMKDLINNDDLFSPFNSSPVFLSLSDVEKSIIFLLFLRFPRNEITSLLGISFDNLRAKIYIIKKKLADFTDFTKFYFNRFHVLAYQTLD